MLNHRSGGFFVRRAWNAGARGGARSRRVFRYAVTASLLALVANAVLLPSKAYGRVDDLSVSNYEYVSATRVGRSHYDFVYRITVSNPAEALTNVVASASSNTTNTSIISGIIDIGDIASGASVQGVQTFVFRQDRRYRFDPDSIVWTFTADPAEPDNTPPVANAGPDQVLAVNSNVRLDGSGSTDADGDPLSYNWTLESIPSGSTAALDDPASPMPGFFADRPGDYVAGLVVNDGQDSSDPDQVVISSSNTPPVADAGLDQTAPVGATVMVFGSASFDANGDALTYAWTLLSTPQGSSAALSSVVDETTGLTLDVAGEYVVQLIVNDGYDDSVPDTATISTSNTPPVADAGGPYPDVTTGDSVDLDGTMSFDVDDDPLSYLWSILSQPEGSAAVVTNALLATARLVTEIDGLYIVQLIVNDGISDSEPSTASINAVSVNEPPLARVTASATSIEPGATVQLDGSGSSDPEGASLSYLWSLSVPAGSNATLDSPTSASPAFNSDVAGNYTATLVVNDGEQDSAPASVTVVASASNNPPQLAAVGDRVAFLGTTLQVQLVGSDPDVGDVLTYSLISPPPNAAIDGATGIVTFTPSAAQVGQVGFVAQVSDAGGLSDSRAFSVEVRDAIPETPQNAPPLLDEIPDQLVTVGDALSVQASASDPDAGDTLSFSLPLAPSGMAIDANGLIGFTPVAEQIGAHDVTVQVSDKQGTAALRSFIVTVRSVNRSPLAVDDIFTARMGQTLSVAAPGVLGNDSDPDGDALTATLVSDVSNGTLDLRGDGSLDYTPNQPDVLSQVDLELACDTVFPYGSNGTLTVADIDNDGTTELAGAIWISNNQVPELWIMDATDCTIELAGSPDVVQAGGLTDGPHLGLLDIDGDGDLEIISPRGRLPLADGGFTDGIHLIAMHHDGSLAWPGDGGSESLTLVSLQNAGASWRYSGPTFADLDADGVVEIIMLFDIPLPIGRTTGVAAYDSRDGSLLWEFDTGVVKATSRFKPPVIVDLDLDGTLEIIAHNSIVDHAGNLEFNLPSAQSAGTALVQHLAVAVANFDADPFPEILARDDNFHYRFEHDGTLLWQKSQPNTSRSQITVADFDNDGALEFAYNTSFGNFTATGPGYMVVWEADGETVLWSHEAEPALQLASTPRLRGPAATAWDANNDGAMDLVIHYDFPASADDAIYIFDGRNGDVLATANITAAGNAGDVNRFVTIADVDQDGHAELLSSFNSGAARTAVFRGPASNPLPAAPGVRNQWIFQEAMVDAAGEMLPLPVPHWLTPGLNGWNLLKPVRERLAGTTDSFTYLANDGDLDSNTATVTFEVQPPGVPPIFLSEPDTLTTVGFPYEYLAQVVDTDPGDSVSLALAAAPPGMTIDASGRVSWLPDAEGSFAVTILASDTIGFTTPQTYTLTVGQPVTVPDVTGEAQADASQLLTAASLLTGAVRAETHPTIPAGVVISQSPIAGSVAEFGGRVDLLVSAGPAPEDIDDDNDGLSESQGDCNDSDPAIFPGADDAAGDGVDQDCDGIDGELTLASLSLTPSIATVLTGQAVPVSATGIFVDGTSQDLTAIVAWNNGPTFVSATAGSFVISAERDGIVGSATVEVVERISGDLLPPIAEILAPTANVGVTERLSIVGTATDTNFLGYELAYAPAGSGNFTTIANGTTPVVNGTIGDFDPTLLVNDQYTIRLTVFDTGGNSTQTETNVIVDGNMKIGNFQLSFLDLELPLSGFPLSVRRIYDSRIKTTGDFGVGWRLALDSIDVRPNRILGTGWRVNKSGLVFSLSATDAHVVSVRLPDGRLELFDMFVTPTVSPLVPFPTSSLRARFQPRLGTRGKLRALGSNSLSIFSAQPGVAELTDDVTGEAYQPDLFVYTTSDGTDVTLSISDGIRNIRDRNGNTLTLTFDGIEHSDGAIVAFDRDASGRITSISGAGGTSQDYVYDGNGDLSLHRDVTGNETRFRYNRNHGLIEIIDPLGRSLARTDYDDAGRVVAITDAEGNRTEYQHDLENRREVTLLPGGGLYSETYDNRGNLLELVDPDGVTTTYTWNGFDQLLTETNARGAVQSFGYGTGGSLNEISHSANGAVYSGILNSFGSYDRVDGPLGTSTVFEYDSRGNPVKLTDALGYETRFTYDSRGNLTSKSFPDGSLERYELDSAGRVVTVIGRNGSARGFEYDASGNRVSQSVLAQSAGGETVIRSEASYDARGDLIASTDFEGNSVIIERDALGRELAFTDPLGNRVEKLLNAKGELLGIEFADGTSKLVGRDARGLVTGVQERDGRIASISLSPGGVPTSISWEDSTIGDPSDNVGSSYSANNLGLLAEAQMEDGARLRIAHNDDGSLQSIEVGGVRRTLQFDTLDRLVSEVDPTGAETRYEYDALDRLLATTFPDGSRIESEYDAVGRLTRRIDEEGRSTQFEYDSDGQIVRVVDGLGNATSYVRDPRGLLLAQTDANGNRTTYDYSPNGYRVADIRPDGSRISYEYNEMGWLIRQTNADGSVLDNEYDTNGRIIAKTLDGVRFESDYDEVGRRTSAADTRGTVNYQYDENGRLVRVTEPNGDFVGYDYDPAGRITAIETPSGTVTHAYDEFGRLSQLTDRDGDETVYEYDVLNRLVRTASATMIVERSYDVRHRVTRIDHLSIGGTLLERFDYGYDLSGKVLSVVSLNGDTVSFEYDGAGRLIREQRTGAHAADISYTLDAVGNVIEENSSTDGNLQFTYDAADRLVLRQSPLGLTSYGYDSSGRLLRERGDRNADYSWSADGHMTRYQTSSAGLVDFLYDWDGVLVERRDASGATQFVQDRNRPLANIVEQRDASGRTPITWAGAPLSQGQGSDKKEFVNDLHSGVRGLFDGTSLSSQNSYRAFGAPLDASGDNLLSYRGEWVEPASGNVYLRQRYYDPTTMRFLSPDPADGRLNDPGTLNDFLYAKADPVNFVDPTGLTPSLAQVSVSLGVIGTLESGLSKSLPIELAKRQDVFWDTTTVISGGLDVGFFYGLGLGANANVFFASSACRAGQSAVSWKGAGFLNAALGVAVGLEAFASFLSDSTYVVNNVNTIDPRQFLRFSEFLHLQGGAVLFHYDGYVKQILGQAEYQNRKKLRTPFESRTLVIGGGGGEDLGVSFWMVNGRQVIGGCKGN